MISHGYPKIAAAGLSLGIRGQPEGRGPAGRTITVSPRQPRPEAVFAMRFESHFKSYFGNCKQRKFK